MSEDEGEDDWQEPDLVECIGGPLDGKFVERDGQAFPWPHGWYYLRGAGYTWDGDAGTYTPTDHAQWSAKHHVVWEPN